MKFRIPLFLTISAISFGTLISSTQLSAGDRSSAFYTSPYAPSAQSGLNPNAGAANGGADAPFSGSIGVGYDSMCNFRGVNFGYDAPWASLDTNFSLSSNVSLNLGTWYTNPVSPVGNYHDNDEWDVYAFLGFSMAGFDVSVGGTYFYFAEAGTDAYELGFSLSRSIGFADLGASFFYDFEAEGSYAELSLSKSFKISERVSADFSAGVSYGFDYFGVDGANHAFVRLDLPIALTDTLSISPYVAATFALDSLEEDVGEKDHVFGGISANVSF